jgi:hypothetical protein
MIPSAAVVEREKAKTKTTLNVMQGSMKVCDLHILHAHACLKMIWI